MPIDITAEDETMCSSALATEFNEHTFHYSPSGRNFRLEQYEQMLNPTYTVSIAKQMSPFHIHSVTVFDYI